jgi:hypothetical protein
MRDYPVGCWIDAFLMFEPLLQLRFEPSLAGPFKLPLDSLFSAENGKDGGSAPKWNRPLGEHHEEQHTQNQHLKQK